MLILRARKVSRTLTTALLNGVKPREAGQAVPWTSTTPRRSLSRDHQVKASRVSVAAHLGDGLHWRSEVDAVTFVADTSSSTASTESLQRSQSSTAAPSAVEP